MQRKKLPDSAPPPAVFRGPPWGAAVVRAPAGLQNAVKRPKIRATSGSHPEESRTLIKHHGGGMAVETGSSGYALTIRPFPALSRSIPADYRPASTKDDARGHCSRTTSSRLAALASSASYPTGRLGRCSSGASQGIDDRRAKDGVIDQCHDRSSNPQGLHRCTLFKAPSEEETLTRFPL